MKAVIFICIVIIASLEAHNVHLSQTQKEKVKSYTVECIKETGVKPEIIGEAKKGHLSDDEGLKKFILCFFQKASIVTPDGKLNSDVALSKLPSGIDKIAAAKTLNECKNRKGNSPADTAFEIFKCYYANTKQHVLFE
ncbi:B1 protein-like [Vanessa cardui]|uniref:B1 protein-like n=1 Tax=Vanessa cardui TaxID=171605 RepID=UPI001F143761|nr:B1 protein-like [Vanessa cardui]